MSAVTNASDGQGVYPKVGVPVARSRRMQDSARKVKTRSIRPPVEVSMPLSGLQWPMFSRYGPGGQQHGREAECEYDV
eukprot:8561032-Pyramimonas_sp.AAC.1